MRENGGLTLAQGKTISEWWLPLGSEKILFRGVENTWHGDTVGRGGLWGVGNVATNYFQLSCTANSKTKKSKSVFWR